MKTDMKIIYDPKTDPVYSRPFVDEDSVKKRITMDNRELTYRYIHGGFEGTNVKFLFCFPEREQYKNRFFQHLSPFPGPDEELASMGKTGEADPIAFSLSHGACFAESNMGSGAVFGTEPDATVFYKSSAAVAEYCRVKACEIFGQHRVYGYVYGGSGGGYKTMSCVENTASWDGAVPFVIGSPMSLPNCLTVAAHGNRILRHSWQKIVDALEPGGSGDIYDGLNDEETEALKEIVNIGFPPRMCIAFGSDDDGSLPVLAPVVHQMDPAYFSDFWEKPGYLGANPDGSAVRDRIYHKTKVTGVGIPMEKQQTQETDGRNNTDDAWQKMLSDGSDAYIEVETVPEGEDLYLKGVDILFQDGAAAGKRLRLGHIDGRRLILGMSYGSDDIRDVLSVVKEGDGLVLDNSDYIAIQTYHRHQVPEDPSFHAWDQYRDGSGKPIYPQRDHVISFGFTYGGCGSVQDGCIQSKVIVMNNLMDGDFPWQADWYRSKVEETWGEQAEDRFRIWYNDNCPHGDVSDTGDALRMTSYLGALNLALLEVAAWAEKGELPADNSGYHIMDNQVILADSASERRGIQPVVTLYADGKVLTAVSAGETVHFTADIEIPQGGGSLVSVEWSFEGEQDYPAKDADICHISDTDGVKHIQAKTDHTFTKPGRYFAVVRVAASRTPQDPYIQVRNLARAQIVVS